MRVLLLVLSTLFFSACDSASDGEGNAAGGGNGNANNAGEGGGGGPSGSEDGGESVEAQCMGDSMAVPQASAELALNPTKATELLSGTWTVGLSPLQEQCLKAITVGLDGDAAVKSSGLEGDFLALAELLASGNTEAVNDANEFKKDLNEKLPNMTMTIDSGQITVVGDGEFSGKISVDSASENKAQVTRSNADGSESVNIHFISESMIFVTKEVGGKEGMTFLKSN